jgi:hypothetical protein
VSLLNDITAAVGFRPAIGGSGQQPTPTTGQQPGSPSAGRMVTDRFGNVFESAFSDTMATVYSRGIAGEFDDRTLALEEQAALQRLRIAQQAAGVNTGGATGVPGAADGIGGPASDGSVTGGGQTGATGAAAGPDPSTIAVAEQRELYAVRVRQSEARLANISESLKRDFPLAAGLVSASTGTWDPATFVPQTREQAEAFAHRLVIDATEAAARLEIVKTQLDAAKFELAGSGSGNAELTKLVADLEAAYARQRDYVDKLAGIVDRQSGGQVTDAGEDALGGQTLRGTGDLPVEEIAAALRADGMSEEDIKRVVGATELAVEQEKTPGGSPRLKAVASEMTRTLLAQFNQMVERNRDETRRQETARTEKRRIENVYVERKRSEQRITEQVVTARRIEQQLAAQAQARRSQQAS